jgi:hypothetical protein
MMRGKFGNLAWISVTAAMIGASAQTACIQKADSNSSSSATGTASNPPVGVVDDSAGFYVRAIENENYETYTHAGTNKTSAGTFDWSTTGCKIATTDSNKDLICLIEMKEMDLFFNGIELQHNIPTNMCYYVQISMPWYYRFPVGFGPSSVSVTTDNTASPPTVTSDTNAAGGTSYCAYDYTKWTYSQNSLAAGIVPSEPGIPGPNCCLGRYSRTDVTINTASTTATSSPGLAWGGNAATCIDGPALKTQKLDAQGFPLSDVSFVAKTGLNGKYSIPAPIGIQYFSSNFYASNYFNVFSDYDTATDYPPAFRTANNTVRPI